MIKIKFLTLLNTFIGKWKDPDPHPDLYLWLTDPDADPGSPKTYGSYGSGSGCVSWSRTLVYIVYFHIQETHFPYRPDSCSPGRDDERPVVGSLFYLTAGDLNAEEEDVVGDLNAEKEGEIFGDFNATRETRSCRDPSPLQDLNASPEDRSASRGDLNASRGDFNAFTGDLNSSRGDLNAFRGDLNASRGDLNAFRGDLKASSGDINASRGDLNASREDLNALRVLSAEAISAAGDFNASSTLVKAESVTSLAETQIQEQISFFALQ